jgi:hypothetical protein
MSRLITTVTVAMLAAALCLDVEYSSGRTVSLQLPAVHIDASCDNSCTDNEKADTSIAVQGLNATEATSCFADYIRSEANIDQKRWHLDHPGEMVKTTDQILADLQDVPVATKIEIFAPNLFLRFTKYGSTCALDGNDSDHVSPKDTCYESEDYRQKAMTIGHEVSHKLHYEHDGNKENGNERTVPYLTQYAICNCWNKANGPSGPNRPGINHPACEYPIPPIL